MNTQTIKNQLEEDLAQVLDNIQRNDANNPATDKYRDMDNEMEDDYIESEEGFRVVTLLAELNQQKDDIERALKRIADGSFGTCDDCSQEIAEARLNAFPTSRLCIKCQEKKESQPVDFN